MAEEHFMAKGKTESYLAGESDKEVDLIGSVEFNDKYLVIDNQSMKRSSQVENSSCQ